MNRISPEHGTQHLELVCLYALQALAPSQMSEVESNLSNCADCREEMETMRPIVDSFLAWPADVLRPSTSLWERLSQRITGDDGGEPQPSTPQRWTEPEWEDVGPGISCKVLSVDAAQYRVSMLVRLAPGAAYPGHRHAGVEELHLLRGKLVVDDRKLFPGDFIRAESGSEDHLVWSETGCVCFLMTSTRDELR